MLFWLKIGGGGGGEDGATLMGLVSLHAAPCATNQCTSFTRCRIEAAIVRIMKARKKRPHNLLVAEVSTDCSIRELKQRRSWATNGNRKFTFLLFSAFYASISLMASHQTSKQEFSIPRQLAETSQ